MTATESQAVGTHELVAGRLREAGRLYTQGRRKLVELLLRTARPTTIPELLASEPRLRQSSVYRNLADLESVSLVRRVAGTDELTRYEFSEDILGHHHHMICTTCGVVHDFVLPPSVEQAIQRALATTLSDAGFEAGVHRLDVEGTCAECR
jgi:Fur family zinc uptake transcriptional regulator